MTDAYASYDMEQGLRSPISFFDSPHAKRLKRLHAWCLEWPEQAPALVKHVVLDVARSPSDNEQDCFTSSVSRFDSSAGGADDTVSCLT